MGMGAEFSFRLMLAICFLFHTRLFLSCSARSGGLQAATPKAKTSSIHQFLAPHNVERRKLGLPPLRWSNKLAQFAAAWAHDRRQDCELVHSNSDYGENIFWGSGEDWEPGDAVAAWAEEKRNYDYGTNGCVEEKECLHYTQIIWRETARVGCASVVCKSGDTFITCNYDPHGNVIGQRPF